MKANELLIVQGTDYKNMAYAILEEADLAGRIPSKDTRIGLKPNIVGLALPEDGATTHPEVTAGVIEYLKAHGFMNIAILEGSWVGDRTMEAAALIGYDRLCETYGVPLIDMQAQNGVRTDCAGMELEIGAAALDIDFWINLPVLKGHCQTKITCALKNMKGLLPNREKRRFHRLGLHEPIGHLAAGIRQDFILVDSICGDLTLEDGGNPIRQDRLIAAVDPVLCDAYGCSILGIDPTAVPYIGIACALGAGSMDLSGAVIRKFVYEQSPEGSLRSFEEGVDHDPDVRGGFKEVMTLADNVCEVESCSACYGCLIPALEQLRREGLLDRLQEKIAIGQGYRGKSGELGVGNCTKGFRHTLAGCPPTQEQMAQFLREYILSSDEVKES